MVLFEIHQKFKGYFFNKLRVSFKNTWKCIKRSVFLKNYLIAPSVIIDNSQTITKPSEIDNAFDIYFVNDVSDLH